MIVKSGSDSSRYFDYGTAMSPSLTKCPQPGTYLDHDTDEIPYSDFINRELILFSIADNVRSIPSACDGLKPGQRKVIWGCFKRKLKKEIKVRPARCDTPLLLTTITGGTARWLHLRTRRLPPRRTEFDYDDRQLGPGLHR